MVKNKTDDKRIRPAPCSHRLTVRRWSCVVLAVLVLCCSLFAFAPSASAAGIVNNMGVGVGHYKTLSPGILTVYPSYDGEDYRVFQFDFFVDQIYNSLPQHSTYYIYEIGKEIYNQGSPSGNEEIDCTYLVSQARKALLVGGSKLWVVRSRFGLTPGSVSNRFITSGGYTFNFEPFATRFDADILAHLFEYNCETPTKIKLTATYYTASSGDYTFTYTNDIVYSAAQGYVYPLEDYAAWVEQKVNHGSPILFTKLTLDIENYTDSSFKTPLYSTGIDYGVLSIQYGGENEIPPNGPFSYTVNDFWIQLRSYWENINPDVGNLPTSFLAQVVEGFFDVEVMPDFTIGSVISVVMMAAIVLLLLKFFAGG